MAYGRERGWVCYDQQHTAGVCMQGTWYFLVTLLTSLSYPTRALWRITCKRIFICFSTPQISWSSIVLVGSSAMRCASASGWNHTSTCTWCYTACRPGALFAVYMYIYAPGVQCASDTRCVCVCRSDKIILIFHSFMNLMSHTYMWTSLSFFSLPAFLSLSLSISPSTSPLSLPLVIYIQKLASDLSNLYTT